MGVCNYKTRLFRGISQRRKPIVDHAQLTALVRRAQELAAQASVPLPHTVLALRDEKDVALAHYRTIAGLCAQASERLRPQEGQASPEAIEAVQVFLQI